MKLPDSWRLLFEARVSDRIEPIRKDYEKKISNTGLDYNQRLIWDANALAAYTQILFEIETQTLIEIYRERGGYADDQDYDDFKKRLDTIAQTHIGHFDHSHTNVFSQQNEFILKGQLEFVEREVKANVGRALRPLRTFILEGKAMAEDDKTTSTGKPSSEFPVYMGFKLTSAEKIWLKAVYDKLRTNEEVVPSQMLAQQWGKIPPDFKYKDIDPRLIFFGVDITLLGVLQIAPDTDLVNKTDRVIRCIRQAIIEDPTITSVNSEGIADSTGLSKYEVSFIFGLLSHLGNFWNGGGRNTTGYRQVNIGYESTFREYLSYESIDELLLKLYQRKDLRQISTSEDEQLAQSPPTPRKSTRDELYQYEVNDIYSEEDFQQLVKSMFDYQNRPFYLYRRIDGDTSGILIAKEELGEIYFSEAEFFYYKVEKNHFYFSRNNIRGKGPEYMRSTMQLPNRKRIEMETLLKIELEELHRKERLKRMNTYDVFISYASADENEANLLYKAVQQAGGKAFLAAMNINPGEDSADKIRDSLVESTELWLLASPISLQSDWVLSEWGAAWVLKTPIIPILHRCSVKELPERLQRLQVIDFYRYQDLTEARKDEWAAT